MQTNTTLYRKPDELGITSKIQSISLSLVEANVLRKNGRKGSHTSVHLSTHQQIKDFLSRSLPSYLCVGQPLLDLSPMQYFILIKCIFDLGLTNILWSWFPPLVISCPEKCVNYILSREVVSADALIHWLYYKRWIVTIYHIMVLFIYISHKVFIFSPRDYNSLVGGFYLKWNGQFDKTWN